MKILELLEKTLSVIVIMSFGGTVLPVLLTGGNAVESQESAGAILVFMGIYVLIMMLLCVRPRIALRLPVANIWITAVVILAFASALWSIDPDVTVRRSVAFLFTTVFGLYLATRFSFPETVRLLATGLSLLMLISLASVFLMPDVGLDAAQHVGAWKGIFFQKNVTGRMMVWLVLCLLWLDWMREGKRWVVRPLLALTLLLIVMSRSSTGLVTSLLVGGALLSTAMVRGNIRTFAPALAFLLLLGVAGVTGGAAFYHDVLYMLGRDATLTGRTVLWEHTLMSIQDHFILGYGYAAYWYGDYGPGSAFTTGWGINSAHNAWMEVLLDLGLPGLIITAVLLGRMLIQGFLDARYGADRAEPAWIFAVACAMLAVSISESLFLERHSINWVIFVVCVVRLAQRRRNLRLATQQQAHNARIQTAMAHAAYGLHQSRPPFR
jgi:O-antigen ligase